MTPKKIVYAKRGPDLLFPQADQINLNKFCDIEIGEYSPTTIRNSLQYLARSRDKKFATKTIPAENVVRVWRTK